MEPLPSFFFQRVLFNLNFLLDFIIAISSHSFYSLAPSFYLNISPIPQPYHFLSSVPFIHSAPLFLPQRFSFLEYFKKKTANSFFQPFVSQDLDLFFCPGMNSGDICKHCLDLSKIEKPALLTPVNSQDNLSVLHNFFALHSPIFPLLVLVFFVKAKNICFGLFLDL